MEVIRMIFFGGSVATISLSDQNTSDYIRKGLGVYSMNEEFKYYRTNCHDDVNRMKEDRIQKKSFKYIPHGRKT
jgi:hypothetical protein